MTKYPLDKNQNINYVDENELFILYSLMRRKYISSQDEVFIPKINKRIHITKEIKNLNVLKKEIEKEVEYLYNANQSKLDSPIIALYLLELGQELDKNNFSIQCTADYSLSEGGFLYDSDNYELMMDYLKYIVKGKKSDSAKFNALTDKQKKSIEACILEKNKRNGKIIFPNSESVLPIKDYKETILNKKGDKDFIFLVNKLITYETSGKWDMDDLIKFIEIFRRHNCELKLFQEDAQSRLSGLIFRNANIVLEIKDTKKIEKDLSEYIDLFINDKLNGFCRGIIGLTSGFFRSSLITPYERVMFGFERQKEILLEHINGEYKKYKRNDLEITNPFFKPKNIDDRPEIDGEIKITFSNVNETEELFLFVHAMIALSKLKYLKIIGFSYGQTELFDPFDRGFLFKIIIGDYFFKNNETKKQELDTFIISVKDREVWVNDYLLSKPHATGCNFEFFEYVRSKPANTPIERDKMPKWGDGVGYASLKEETKSKSFIKMLNELGFKGEILKAFFYKRSKNSLTYRGDKIIKEDLEKAGVKKSLFLKELDVAHAKNSPE